MERIKTLAAGIQPWHVLLAVVLATGAGAFEVGRQVENLEEHFDAPAHKGQIDVNQRVEERLSNVESGIEDLVCLEKVDRLNQGTAESCLLGEN